jgi:hypothetical protein
MTNNNSGFQYQNIENSDTTIKISENVDLGFYIPFINLIDNYLNPFKPKSKVYALFICAITFVFIVCLTIFFYNTKNFKVFTIDNINDIDTNEIRISSNKITNKYTSTISPFFYTIISTIILLHILLSFLVVAYFYSKFCVRFASFNFFKPLEILFFLILFLFMSIMNIIFLLNLYRATGDNLENGSITKQFKYPQIKDLTLSVDIGVGIVFGLCMAIRTRYFTEFGTFSSFFSQFYS